jgi:hypothetical protein
MGARAVERLPRCRAVELVSEGKTYEEVAKEVERAVPGNSYAN